MLQVAIEQALTIIGWHENLSTDEVPPEYLWEDSEGLELWWADVKARREDNMPMPNRGSSRSDDDDEHPDSGMAENDLARAFKG